MIRYALRCDQAHRFDSWFGSGADFDRLRDAGLLACAVCGSTAVEKDLMAPNVAAPRRPSAPLSAPASPAEQALAELRRRIEAESEDVGRDFAAEARRIHEGRAPERADHRRGAPGRGPRADRGRHPGRPAALVVGQDQLTACHPFLPSIPDTGQSAAAKPSDPRPVVRHDPRAPAVGRVVLGRRDQPEPLGRIIGIERSAFGAARAGAARQRSRKLAVNLEGDLAAMAASCDHRLSPVGDTRDFVAAAAAGKRPRGARLGRPPHPARPWPCGHPGAPLKGARSAVAGNGAMPRLVMKFGGTSVADLDRIRNAAAKVKREVERGYDVAVVVSAMAGKTNELVGWVRQHLAALRRARIRRGGRLRRERDRRPDGADPAGDRGAGAQLAGLAGAAAHQLEPRGGPHRGDRDRGGWSEVRRGAARGDRRLPGHQPRGTDHHARPRRLGHQRRRLRRGARGRALRHLHRRRRGLHHRPAHHPQGAQARPRSPTRRCWSWPRLGAKVLQTRSVELAMRYKVRLQVLSSFIDGPGTLVCDEEEIVESRVVSGVAHSRDEAKVTVIGVARPPGRRRGDLRAAGRGRGQRRHDRAEHRRGRPHRHDLLLPDRRGAAARAGRSRTPRPPAGSNFHGLDVDEDVAKVSIVGIGMRSQAGVAHQMFAALARGRGEYQGHHHLGDQGVGADRPQISGTGGAGTA